MGERSNYLTRGNCKLFGNLSCWGVQIAFLPRKRTIDRKTKQWEKLIKNKGGEIKVKWGLWNGFEERNSFVSERAQGGVRYIFLYKRTKKCRQTTKKGHVTKNKSIKFADRRYDDVRRCWLIHTRGLRCYLQIVTHNVINSYKLLKKSKINKKSIYNYMYIYICTYVYVIRYVANGARCLCVCEIIYIIKRKKAKKYVYKLLCLEKDYNSGMKGTARLQYFPSVALDVKYFYCSNLV